MYCCKFPRNRMRVPMRSWLFGSRLREGCGTLGHLLHAVFAPLGPAALQAARREEWVASRRAIEEQMLEKEKRRFLEGEAAAAAERDAVSELVRKVQADDLMEAQARAAAREQTRVRGRCSLLPTMCPFAGQRHRRGRSRAAAVCRGHGG